MIQLAFGLGIDKSSQSWWMDAIRGLFAGIDIIVYKLLSFIYEILFNIAQSTIIDSGTIKLLYGRVQLIIGVFMIFKLTVSIFQAVINPDALADKKKGMGQIITRIITMLAMFTAIMPLNIPNATPGSYNAYLNQSGLLFGTMYSLQARILNQGVIQKLILPNYTSPENNEDNDISSGTDTSSGNSMASFLLRVFVRINAKDINESLEYENGEPNYDNYMIPEKDLKSKYSDAYDIYIDEDSDLDDILININATDGNSYAFAYCPFVSTIVAVIMIVILLSFCIDVSIRTLKLAILRLIAPIPIISYIDPKSSEKGAFANWTKLLISTFINLFIILAIVHFVIFLGEQLISSENGTGLAINVSDSVIVNLLTVVFIIIGVFYFAKQAPKFIMDALGIKSMGFGVGLSGLMGALGGFTGGGGLRGAAAGFMGASNDASNAAAQGKQAPPALQSQRANMAKMITGDDKNDGSLGYRMQQSLYNRAGAKRANRLYGINAGELEARKSRMYALQDDAARVKNAYDNYVRGNASKADAAKILGTFGYNYDNQTGILKDQDGNLVNDSDIATHLQEAYLNASSAAGKAKSDYEKMDKIGKRMGVSQTDEQLHRASLRERATSSGLGTAYRAIRQGHSTVSAGGSVGSAIHSAGEVIHRERQTDNPSHQSFGQRVGYERDEHGHLQNHDNRF